MKKEQIIKIVNEVKSNLDTGVFAGDNNTDSYKIGCNQFRELASICRRAECFEELELLIKYNEAKAGTDKNGNPKSWYKKMKNGKTLAACIIDGMNKIRSESSESDCLEALRLYFGYFYWNARIYAAENKEKNQSHSPDSNKEHKGNNNRRNDNRGNGYKGRG